MKEQQILIKIKKLVSDLQSARAVLRAIQQTKRTIQIQKKRAALLDAENARSKYLKGRAIRRLENRSRVRLPIAASSLVEDLGLTTRAANILYCADITTVGQLVKKTAWEMSKYRNCGPLTVAEIVLVLEEHGLELGTPTESF